MNILAGARPPRRYERTISKGLTDNLWTRVVQWWHRLPSQRPLLPLERSASTVEGAMMASTAPTRTADEIVTGTEDAIHTGNPMVFRSLAVDVYLQILDKQVIGPSGNDSRYPSSGPDTASIWSLPSASSRRRKLLGPRPPKQDTPSNDRSAPFSSILQSSADKTTASIHPDFGAQMLQTFDKQMAGDTLFRTRTDNAPTRAPASPRQHESSSGITNGQSFDEKKAFIRPPPEEVHDRLEEYFERLQLDEPLGETSSTSLDRPPLPAIQSAPTKSRSKHKKSIRLVAAQHTSRITDPNMRRKRSTKLWGSRVEDVSSGDVLDHTAKAIDMPESPMTAPKRKF
jgi:hypothetical protein